MTSDGLRGYRRDVARKWATQIRYQFDGTATESWEIAWYQ